MTPPMTLNDTQARENMVEQQVRPWDVLDARVLETLATLPRLFPAATAAGLCRPSYSPAKLSRSVSKPSTGVLTEKKA